MGLHVMPKALVVSFAPVLVSPVVVAVFVLSFLVGLVFFSALAV